MLYYPMVKAKAPEQEVPFPPVSGKLHETSPSVDSIHGRTAFYNGGEHVIIKFLKQGSSLITNAPTIYIQHRDAVNMSMLVQVVADYTKTHAHKFDDWHEFQKGLIQYLRAQTYLVLAPSHDESVEVDSSGLHSEI